MEPGGDDPGVRAGRPHQDQQQAREQAEAAVGKVTLFLLTVEIIQEERV